VTTILTDETRKPSGPEMEMRVEGISALVENLLLLEYMTIGPKLRRLIAIVKQRASAHETSAREFFLSGRGIEVAPDARSAAEVASSRAHLGNLFTYQQVVNAGGRASRVSTRARPARWRGRRRNRYAA